jgi:hypothetical protein
MSYENSMGSGLQKTGIVVFHILFETAKIWHSPPKVRTKTIWEAPCGARNRIRFEEDTSIEDTSIIEAAGIEEAGSDF